VTASTRKLGTHHDPDLNVVVEPWTRVFGNRTSHHERKVRTMQETDWAACGTEAQYKRHYRRGETCTKCRDAANQAAWERKSRKRKAEAGR